MTENSEAGTGAAAEPRTGDSARETGPALEAHYRFTLWLVPVLERLSQSQKFLLGDRMQGAALDVLDSLIKANLRFTPTSAQYIQTMPIPVLMLRFLCRFARGPALSVFGLPRLGAALP